MNFKETPKTGSPEMLHPDKGATFEEFLPFVKVEDNELRERFVKLLRAIFNHTNTLWQPGSCRSTQELERILKVVQAQYILGDVVFTPMTYLGGTHFFLTVRFKDREETLVVDPFGVPSGNASEGDYMRNARLITPFFGEVKLAPPRHQGVYSGAKIEDGGYHSFHP